MIGIQDNQSLTLLYRASRDGFEAASFHSLCDGNGQTLTIIQSTVSLNIFGAYINIPWASTGGIQADLDAFIFSLTNYENSSLVAKVNPSGSYALYFDSICGPGFGLDIRIADLSNVNTGSFAEFGLDYPFKYAYGTPEARNFLAGTFNFLTAEIEVYQSSTTISGQTSK